MGLLGTIFTIFVISGFTAIKVSILNTGLNPIIVEKLHIHMHEEKDDLIDLTSFNFKIAFSVHSASDRSIKYDDPSKVEWLVRAID